MSQTSYEDTKKNIMAEQAECKTLSSPITLECYSGTKNTTTTMNNKSIQIDMDCEPGEDPKKNKKYWQDIAGLRGAREQYLQLDIRDLGAEQSRKTDYINYLKAKLEMANKEIRTLKAKRCRCQQEETHVEMTNKQFSSMGL